MKQQIKEHGLRVARSDGIDADFQGDYAWQESSLALGRKTWMLLYCDSREDDGFPEDQNNIQRDIGKLSQGLRKLIKTDKAEKIVGHLGIRTTTPLTENCLVDRVEPGDLVFIVLCCHGEVGHANIGEKQLPLAALPAPFVFLF